MSSNDNKCFGCRSVLPKKEYIDCSHCHRSYDLLCANISSKRFYLMDQQRKKCWKCLECQSKKPKSDNSNTPVRANMRSFDSDDESASENRGEESNVTLRVKKHRSKSDSGDCYVTEDNLRKIIRQDMTEIITDLVSKHLASITNQIIGFQESLSFLSKQYDDLKQSVEEKNIIISNLESKNTSLTSQVKSLSERLGQIEQHARSNNLEINGVPEHRAENLFKTIEQLGNTVDNPFAENDILHVTRISKLNKDSDRPRAVIVQLRSQRRRDELLAAVIRYNKKNKVNKLNSEHLGYGGRQVPVFVSEHLTPSNKSLHAATRTKAKEAGYKFVWVRDGRIFTRKNEQSPAIVIRDVECLKSLT